jgi:hypothetical protein
MTLADVIATLQRVESPYGSDLPVVIETPAGQRGLDRYSIDMDVQYDKFTTDAELADVFVVLDTVAALHRAAEPFSVFLFEPYKSFDNDFAQ